MSTNTHNLNRIVGGSVETAQRWLNEGDDPADVYQALVPAILAANAQQSLPRVNPTTELENLLRQKAGWDPSRGRGTSTAADWGPC